MIPVVSCSDDQTGVQIVGMSATLPNLDLLARWLSADLYRTEFRPIPLQECVKIGPTVYDKHMKPLRDLDKGGIQFAGDDGHILPLCLETLRDGHSVLIFCPTKNWCEKLAITIAKGFFKLNKQPPLTDQGNSLFVTLGAINNCQH